MTQRVFKVGSCRREGGLNQQSKCLWLTRDGAQDEELLTFTSHSFSFSSSSPEVHPSGWGKDRHASSTKSYPINNTSTSLNYRPKPVACNTIISICQEAPTIQHKKSIKEHNGLVSQTQMKPTPGLKRMLMQSPHWKCFLGKILIWVWEIVLRKVIWCLSVSDNLLYPSWEPKWEKKSIRNFLHFSTSCLTTLHAAVAKQGQWAMPPLPHTRITPGFLHTYSTKRQTAKQSFPLRPTRLSSSWTWQSLSPAKKDLHKTQIHRISKMDSLISRKEDRSVRSLFCWETKYNPASTKEGPPSYCVITLEQGIDH